MRDSKFYGFGNTPAPIYLHPDATVNSAVGTDGKAWMNKWMGASVAANEATGRIATERKAERIQQVEAAAKRSGTQDIHALLKRAERDNVAIALLIEILHEDMVANPDPEFKDTNGPFVAHPLKGQDMEWATACELGNAAAGRRLSDGVPRVGCHIPRALLLKHCAESRHPRAPEFGELLLKAQADDDALMTVMEIAHTAFAAMPKDRFGRMLVEILEAR